MYLSFKGEGVLRSIGLAICSKRAVMVLNTSKSKGSALLGLVVKLLGPSSNSVGIGKGRVSSLARQRVGRRQHHVKVMFRCSTLFSSVGMGRGMTFNLQRRASLSRRRVRGVARKGLRLMNLSSINSLVPTSLSNNVGGHIDLTETVTLGPRVVLCSRPATKLSPVHTASVDLLVGRVRGRVGIADVIIARSLGSTRVITSEVTFLCGNSFLTINAARTLTFSESCEIGRFVGKLPSRRCAMETNRFD